MTNAFTMTAVAMASLIVLAVAQDPSPRPQFQSVEVRDDKKITFRIHAPKADEVKLSSPDLQGLGSSVANMKIGDEGVWEVTVGPALSGSYRYHFDVDGLNVIDPKNGATSESNTHTWSLMHAIGSEWSDTKDVPHGAVSEVTYYSESLKRFRRMHVYTPPGYESGEGNYPTLYLLHGALDSDDSWSTIGRAGFILDNLIASGKAIPMVVVMPKGHTGPFYFGMTQELWAQQMQDFKADFEQEIRPHIEKSYRVYQDRPNRAIAGLSMGGAHAIMLMLANLKDYAYIGVFSSGVFGIHKNAETWEKENASSLANAESKKSLRLLWFATGKEDFVIEMSRKTVEVLKKHEFDVIYNETEGGHTWLKWRDYLAEFVPQIFQH